MKIKAWILYFSILFSVPLPGQEVVTALRHPTAATPTFTHRAGQAAFSSNATSASSITVTLAANPTTSDLVTCFWGVYSSVTSFVVKDSAGTPNSYAVTAASPHTGTSGFFFYTSYLLVAPSTATKTITASWTGATGFQIGICDEVVDSSPGHQTFDKEAFEGAGTASGTTINSPSLTPAVSNEFIFAAAIPNDSISAPTAGATLGVWTGSYLDSSGSGIGSEYDLSASTLTAVQFTDNTSSDPYNAISVGFEP